MLDFSSALYLGLHHDSRSLEPWRALTTGRPAALQEPDGAAAVARDLATLLGCAAGVLLPSSFVLFWDLLGVLSAEPLEIFVDAATYPIAGWAAGFWAGRGVPVQHFAAHDAAALAVALARPRRGRPLVLCDGVSPGSTRQPPLAGYAALVQRHGGWLVVDDTQALGVYGHGPTAAAPYGTGGGGALRHQGVAGPHVLVAASLAKGLGVPVAVLAGAAPLLKRFVARSASREHMSPPNAAVIHAAAHALAVHQREGGVRRQRLWQAVRRLRAGLRRQGLATQADDFPVQTLSLPPGTDAAALHGALLQRHVRTVLHRGAGGAARLSFLLRADHGPAAIDTALARLAEARRALVHQPLNRRTPCTP